MAVSAQPAQVSPEPKKIHTVTIRADQSASAGAAPASSMAPAAAPPVHTQGRSSMSVARASAAAAAPPSGHNAPLSLVPGQGEALVRSHGHGGTAPMTLANAGAPAAAPAARASGGYAVQVTSQRSESEAHAAFRALQAKYPTQLGGREPIIHRADLGAKGTFYRALVGPFASAEEAASLCSGLKAAGGNCIVQRN